MKVHIVTIPSLPLRQSLVLSSLPQRVIRHISAAVEFVFTVTFNVKLELMLLHSFLWRLFEHQDVAQIRVKDHAFRSFCTSLRYTELHYQKKKNSEKSSEATNDKAMEENAKV